MFYHEKKPELSACPQIPEWKRPLDSYFNRESMRGHKYNEATPVYV